MIELKIVEGQDFKKWDTIARESPYGTRFHTLEWMEILALCQSEPRAVFRAGFVELSQTLADDLNDRGIKASLSFPPFTVQNKDFAQELLKKGHSVGLHEVHTKDFKDFSRDLKKLSRSFDGIVYGFTKHGSGKFKLSRRHDPNYDPEKFIESAKQSNLKYFLGNGENPKERGEVVDGVFYFPSAFWLNRNYWGDKFTIDWLADESVNRNIVILRHPMDVVGGTELLVRDYEWILDKVKIIRIDEIILKGDNDDISGD
jgi:hypothetical protein